MSHSAAASSRPGQRIIVVGPAGSGKSTLAARLSERLNLPLVELDALYWAPGWQAPAPEVFVEKVRTAVTGKRWVVVGNYKIQRQVSWPRAQAVVWLDLALPTCLARILVRSFRRWRSDELLWGTNRERFFPQFALWDEERSLVAYTLRDHGVLRERYATASSDPAWSHLVFHRLKTPRQIESWLERYT